MLSGLRLEPYLGGAGAPGGFGGAPRFGNEPHPVLIEAAIAASNTILINFFFIVVSAFIAK